MMNPKVTVLMSVYNGEMFLQEAIESILNQTYTDLDFLIINDASTDHSREIILSYGDPRIRLIDNEKNTGLTCSLNMGLRLAKGEYIARQDADDISMPERLKKQVEFLEHNSKVVLLGTWAEFVDEEGNVTIVCKNPTDHCSITWRFLFDNCLVHSSLMFRKNNVLRIGGYNSSIAYAQDYDLWIRLSKVGKINQLPEVLLKHRKLSESISDKYSAEQRVTRKQVTFNYAKSIVPEIDNDNFINFMDRTISNDLTWQQIKEIVQLTKKIKEGFFKKNNPPCSCKKEINQDVQSWFLDWANKNREKPLIRLYLVMSERFMRTKPS